MNKLFFFSIYYIEKLLKNFKGFNFKEIFSLVVIEMREFFLKFLLNIFDQDDWLWQNNVTLKNMKWFERLFPLKK